MNKYLEKIAGDKARRVTTGAAAGAGTVGTGAAVGGYLGGNLGSRLMTMGHIDKEISHDIGKAVAKGTGKVGLLVGAGVGALGGLGYHRHKKMQERKALPKEASINKYLEKIAAIHNV